MKTATFIFLLLFSGCQWLAAQCPTNITSQAQVDSFSINYPTCTDMPGDLIISGSDITSLSGLSQLTSIGGTLSIRRNEVLSSLSGLENITSLNGDLEIRGNVALISLDGLENLTAVGGSLSLSRFSPSLFMFIGNNVLTSLTGLDNKDHTTQNITCEFLCPGIP